MNNKFTHIDHNDNPTMVDISDKKITLRIAEAMGEIYLPPLIWIKLENNEIITKKGAVFQTAIIAATMAVKKTQDLIPFCHSIPIESCKIKISTNSDSNIAQIICTVKTTSKTGVEMEALTGVSTAALTIYDMCKALSHDMEIKKIRLIEKSGGKSDIKNSSN